MMEKLATWVGVVVIIILVIGGVGNGVDMLTDKVKTSVIQKIWPKYQTSTEKRLKIQTQERNEKERIFTNLNRWLDKWVKENRSRLAKSDNIGFNPYQYRHLVRVDNNIWVVAGIPYGDAMNINPSSVFRKTKDFILHSPDNGKDWEIIWEKPSTDLWWYNVGLGEIKVINKERICVKLGIGGISLGFPMLYTINGGKNWQIDEKWKPEKVKKL